MKEIQSISFFPEDNDITGYYNKEGKYINSKTLWIGNVDTSFTEKKLIQVCSGFGKVSSVKIIRETCCAFVNFQESSALAKAYYKLNGKNVKGLFFGKINIAKPNEMVMKNSNSTKINTEKYLKYHERGTVLRLRGLPFYSKVNDIQEFFQDYDLANRGIYIPRMRKGTSGDAFIAFASKGEATRALERRNHHYISWRYLELSYPSYNSSESDEEEEGEINSIGYENEYYQEFDEDDYEYNDYGDENIKINEEIIFEKDKNKNKGEGRNSEKGEGKARGKGKNKGIGARTSTDKGKGKGKGISAITNTNKGKGKVKSKSKSRSKSKDKSQSKNKIKTISKSKEKNDRKKRNGEKKNEQDHKEKTNNPKNKIKKASLEKKNNNNSNNTNLKNETDQKKKMKISKSKGKNKQKNIKTTKLKSNINSNKNEVTSKKNKSTQKKNKAAPKKNKATPKKNKATPKKSKATPNKTKKKKKKKKKIEINKKKQPNKVKNQNNNTELKTNNLLNSILNNGNQSSSIDLGKTIKENILEINNTKQKNSVYKKNINIQNKNENHRLNNNLNEDQQNKYTQKNILRNVMSLPTSTSTSTPTPTYTSTSKSTANPIYNPIQLQPKVIKISNSKQSSSNTSVFSRPTYYSSLNQSNQTNKNKFIPKSSSFEINTSTFQKHLSNIALFPPSRATFNTKNNQSYSLFGNNPLTKSTSFQSEYTNRPLREIFGSESKFSFSNLYFKNDSINRNNNNNHHHHNNNNNNNGFGKSIFSSHSLLDITSRKHSQSQSQSDIFEKKNRKRNDLERKSLGNYSSLLGFSLDPKNKK